MISLEADRRKQEAKKTEAAKKARLDEVAEKLRAAHAREADFKARNPSFYSDEEEPSPCTMDGVEEPANTGDSEEPEPVVAEEQTSFGLGSLENDPDFISIRKEIARENQERAERLAREPTAEPPVANDLQFILDSVEDHILNLNGAIDFQKLSKLNPAHAARVAEKLTKLAKLLVTTVERLRDQAGND